MSEMTKEELIELINMAENKDDIEALVRSVDFITEDVDKRGGLETVRAKALALINGDSQSDSEESEEVTSSEGELTGEQIPVADVQDPLNEQALPQNQDVQQTVAGIVGSTAAVSPVIKTRLLRSKKTGVEFVWTEALAKLSGMEEV